MAALPARTFTAFDLPGHGESDFDETTDIQAQAVETAITLLEASGPSDVFGHSFGATVALKLAIERPDLVRRLCLYEPVYFAVLAAANPEAYTAEAKASSAFTEAALAGDWPTAARAFLSRWGGEAFDDLPQAAQAYILKTIPLIVATGASIIAPEKGAEVLAKMAGLRVPLLLITGETSPVVIAEIAAALAESGTGVMRMQLQQAAHMGPVSHPKNAAEMIANFIV